MAIAPYTFTDSRGREITLIRDAEGDTVNGGDAIDIVLGGSGDDIIDGGGGNDLLFSGNGDDRVEGGSGNDGVYGGSGNDVLDGGAGADRVDGGAGNDVLIWRGFENGDGRDIYLGGTGTDTLVLEVTTAQYNDPLARDEFDAFLRTPQSEGFIFTSLNLRVQGFERVQVRIFDIEPPVSVNEAPEAVADAFTVQEDDGATVIDLLANDTDDAVGLRVVAIEATGLVGSVVLGQDGMVTYDPAGAFEALAEGETTTQSFDYTVEDAGGLRSTATVTLTIEGTNDAPTVAGVFLADGVEDQAFTFTFLDLLEGTTDVDASDFLAVRDVTIDGIVLEPDASGTFTYLPPADANGAFTVDFSVTDGRSTVANTATFTLEARNDDPVVGAPLAVSGEEDRSVSIAVADLLADATDIDGDTLTLDPGSLSATDGTVSLANGVVTYTPNSDYNGAAMIGYTLVDGQGGSAAGSVSISLAAVNDAPLVADVSLTPGTEDETYIVTAAELLAGASDVDGDDLSVVSVSRDGTALVFDDVAGGFVLDLPANANGAYTLDFSVTDGTETVQAVASVDIQPADDPITGPAAVALAPVAEGVGRTLTSAELLAGISNIDGDELTISNLAVSAGRVTDNGDGTWLFQNRFGDSSQAVFTFDVSDGDTTLARTALADIEATGPVAVESTRFGSGTETIDGVEYQIVQFDFDALSRTFYDFDRRYDDGDQPGSQFAYSFAIDGEPVALDGSVGTQPVVFLFDEAPGDGGRPAFGFSNAFDGTFEFTVEVRDENGDTDTLTTTVSSSDLERANDLVDLGAGDVRTNPDASEYVRGTSGADVLEQGVLGDTFYGLGGDDILTGSWISGGKGFDILTGTEGADFIADNGDGADIRAGAGDDQIDAFGSATIDAGSGDDLIFAETRSNSDEAISVFAGEGDDIIDASGNVSVDGGAGNDWIVGGAVVNGGAGSDYISLGSDSVVTGGADGDAFAFEYNQNNRVVGFGGSATITDFETGIDLIVLNGTDDDRTEDELFDPNIAAILASEVGSGDGFRYQLDADRAFTVNVALSQSDFEVISGNQYALPVDEPDDLGSGNVVVPDPIDDDFVMS